MAKRRIKRFDLGERTERFGLEIISLAKSVPVGPITQSLVSQLIKAGTSVGANYAEADNASSKKDFIHKIYLCKKEAKETVHWLKMIIGACPNTGNTAAPLIAEAGELVFIFGAIIRNAKIPKSQPSSFSIRNLFVIRHSAFVIPLSGPS